MSKNMKKGLPMGNIVLNEALIDAFGSRVGEQKKPGDTIDLDTAQANATHTTPWSGNVYTYNFEQEQE